MRRALVMMCLVSLTLQAYNISLLPLPPLGDGRVMADFLAQDALIYAKVTLATTTARLQRLIAEMNEQALARAYQQRESWKRREVMQYLPSYCPLAPDDRAAAFPTE